VDKVAARPGLMAQKLRAVADEHGLARAA